MTKKILHFLLPFVAGLSTFVSKKIIRMIPQINKLKNTNSGNFFLLAGPCAIEGEKMAMEIAEKIVVISEKLKSRTFLRVRIEKQTVRD